MIILLNVILRIGCSLFCLQIKITSRRCCWSGQERPTAWQNSSENNHIWWFQWWNETFLVWKWQISFWAARKLRKLCRPEWEYSYSASKIKLTNFLQWLRLSAKWNEKCQVIWVNSDNSPEALSVTGVKYMKPFFEQKNRWGEGREKGKEKIYSFVVCFLYLPHSCLKKCQSQKEYRRKIPSVSVSESWIATKPTPPMSLIMFRAL